MKKNKNRKKPTHSYNPEITKRLPCLGSPNLENTYLAWRFSNADTGGPFSCAQFSLDDFKQLWERLSAFETKNIEELRNSGSFHNIPLEKFEKEARDRLDQLQLDDLEELYSFRMDGKCRLYCIKYLNIFSVLWWDSKHKAYLVRKSHT